MKPAVTTITLLVANVILLGYIFLIDRKNDDTGEGLVKDTLLADFEPENVTRMLLETSEGKAEVEKLSDDSWRFVAPFSDRFDPKIMEELLGDAARTSIHDSMSAKEVDKEDLDDAYFGFGKGSIKVQLLAADGKSLSHFELGAPTPVKDLVYARRIGGDDDAVHTVVGYVREIVSLPFVELRDKRLIYAKVDDVFRAKFRPAPAGSLEVHVEKGVNSRWRMEHPLTARCDEELVEELISNLTKLEVAEFVDQPGADMEAAFGDKRYEIVLRQRTTAADNAKITIEFGALPTDENEPYVLARVSDREGVLFKVDRRVHWELGITDGNSLRDRTLADFEYNAVSEVRIKRGAEEIVLVRGGNVWALKVGPDQYESANGRMVKELIEDINDEEIVKFASDAAADLEPYGLIEPPVTVTITSVFIDPEEEVAPGEQPTFIPDVKKLMFGASNAFQPVPETFAAVEGEHFVYKIGDLLPPRIARLTARSFRTLQLWPRFTPFDLKKITLSEGGDGEALELVYDHDRNSWTARLGDIDVTDDIDPVILNAYMGFLGGPPIGEEWSPPSRRSTLRLSEPDLRLTIDMTDPQDQRTPRKVTFLATAIQEGGKIYYGRVNGGSDVILLDDALINKLLVPLRRLNK